MSRISRSDEMRGFLLILSTLFIFEPHYFSGTFTFLRTAKILSVGVSILISAFIIRVRKNQDCKGYLIEMLEAFCLSMLLTVDEQIIVVMIIILVLLLIETFFSTKGLYLFKIRLCIETFIFYFLFTNGWGKLLFLYYSGETREHTHNIKNVINRLPVSIYKGLWTWLRAMKFFLFNSAIILLVVFVGWLVILLLCSDWKVRAQSICLICSSAVMSIGMVAAHEPVYSIPELAHVFYYIIPAYLSLLGVVFPILRTDMGGFSKQFMCGIVIIMILVSLYSIMNCRKIATSIATHNGECIINPNSVEYVLSGSVGVEKSFFDGVLISPEEYYAYIGK